MTSSAATTILSEIRDRDALSAGTRAYFRARLKNRLYHLVLTKFQEQAKGEAQLTKARLARRMGLKPEVVTRLLGASGNWTLNTVSDLLLAISGEELEALTRDPLAQPARNGRGADLLAPEPQMTLLRPPPELKLPTRRPVLTWKAA